MNRFSLMRALSLFLLIPAVAGAASFIVPPDRELVEAADAVVVVTIESGVSSFAADGTIVTDYSARIEERFKGAVGAGARIVIREMGGVVGDAAMIASAAPRFLSGERALLFLDRRDGDRWATVSGLLGKFSFVRDAASHLYLARGATEGEIFGWDVRGREHHERLRDATAFLHFVERSVAGEQEEETYFRVASGRLELEGIETNNHVPGNSYLMQFGFPVPGGARWSSGGFSMLVQGDQTGADEEATLSAGLGPWNADPTSSISLDGSGTTATFSYGSSNGSNVTHFGRPNSDPLGGTTVGQALLFASSAPNTNAATGEQFYTSTECDVVIEQGLSGSVLQEVVAHELGHCLGFRHSDAASGSPSATQALMFPSISGRGPILLDWDREAANHVYGDGTLGGTPCTAAAISSHPVSATIAEGESRTLSVTATGTAPLAYQWLLEGSPIGGATSSTFNTGALAEGTHTYRVRVTNACNTAGALSNAAVLTVTASCPLPTINVHPQSTTLTSGQSTTLSVSASGATSYQWYRGTSGNESQPIAGAISSSHGTGSLTSTTSFWVKVSNSCGSRNSNTATVTVQQPCVEPQITNEPQPATVQSGQSALLIVGATGTDLLYQWYRGTPPSTAQPVSGGSFPTLNTGALSATTTFWVMVSNSCGSKNSQAATVTVQSTCTAPQITAHPASPSIQEGQSTTLSVSATGTSLQYQWYQGPKDDLGRPISGATGPAYTTPVLSSTAQYWVRVVNSCGEARSNTATVTVQPSCQAPLIFTQPQSTTVPRNGAALLGVAVSGTAPFTFQWYRGAAGDLSNPIAGATGASYNTGALTKTTSFWVLVSNSCQSTNSQTATVTVPSGRKRIVRR